MSIEISQSANASAVRYAAVAAPVTAILLLVVMNAPGKALLVGPGALAALAVLIFAARFVPSHKVWLAGLLVLEELLPYANVIPYDPQSRWIFRYPILLALCAPMAPAAWRSGILFEGYFKALAAYYGWAAATIVYSLAPAASIGRLVPAVLLFAALAAAVADIREIGDVQRILRRFLFCCGVILGLQVLAAIALPSAMSWSADEPGLPARFSGIFNTPNVLGQLMVVVVGASLVCWQHTSGWRRVGIATLMAVSIALAAVADSRSGFVALGLGGILYAIWKYGIRGLLACAAAALCVIIVWINLSNGARTYFNRNAGDLSGRTEAWRFEIRQICKRPLTGYGYDVEGQIFLDRMFPDWGQFWLKGTNTSVHNGYLNIAIGLGIPALLFWLWAFMRPWISLFASDHDPWELRRIAFLIVVPLLALALAESPLDPIRYPKGVLLFTCWMVAERFRLLERAREASAPAGSLAGTLRAAIRA